MVIVSNTRRGAEQFQGESAKRVAGLLVHGDKAADALLEPSSPSVGHAAFPVDVPMRNFAFFSST